MPGGVPAEFGDMDRALAECRASDERRLGRRRRALVFDAARQDMRYALRSLVKRPALAVTVTVILALGIGANAAVFSVVDPLFFRPPTGVRAPDELKQIYVERRPAKGEPYYQARFSLPEARFIDSAIGPRFPSAIWFQNGVDVEIKAGSPRRVRGGWVTPSYLSVLGVRPEVGSDFDAESARWGVPASTVIVSWEFWQRELGADERALGRAIHVAGRPVTIRAILPRGFAGIDIDAVDIWLPLGGFTGFPDRPGRPRWYDSWGTIAYRVIARVPSGASSEELAARVVAGVRSAAAFVTEHPQPGARAIAVARAVPGSIKGSRGPDGMTRSEMIAAVLGALALLLLLMATANVGNLLLGRALNREREIAVRTVLGMGRRRLVSQLVVESTVLALAATGAALLVGQWSGGILRSMLLPGVVMQGSPVDHRVALVALALGVTVGILSGLVPLSLSLRVDLSNTLKSTSRDGGGRRSRIRSALVGLQAALSVMLLVGTGLLARSLYNIRAIDLGLDVDRVITVIRPDSARGPQLEEIARLAEAMPMVTGAALASARPLDDQFGVRSLFDRNGDTLRAALSDIGFVPAEPGYLAVVGTKVIRGRDFTADDRFGAPPVMIVSEELARRFWPSRSPFGECFRIERADAPCYSVVGIAENAHSFHVVEDPKAVFYVPLDQRPDRTESPRALVIRTSGATAAIADQLRRAIGDTVASARRRQVLVMSELLTSDYDPWELGARLFAGFAALALVLAVLGLYGVLSYLVALRSRELGIRIALGADRRRVMGLVVGEGIRQVAIGALAGAAITLAAAGRMSALLFRVSPRDPVIVLASVVVLVGCAVLAAAIPGRRAMAIDPMQAIRDE